MPFHSLGYFYSWSQGEQNLWVIRRELEQSQTSDTPERQRSMNAVMIGRSLRTAIESLQAPPFSIHKPFHRDDNSPGFQEWEILFRTAELLSLKFNLTQNLVYCHHCLIFLPPSRGYSNKRLQAVLNGWHLCCSKLEEFLLRQENICLLRTPFCIISVIGSAVWVCSNAQWFTLQATVKTLCEVYWLVQGSSGSLAKI